MRRVLFLVFVMLGCSVVAQHFRFAQLTDLHLNSKVPSHKQDLQESIDRINALDSIDFVLITGDISDDGDQLSMQEAKGCLDRLRVPYYIVMGNHETKWSASGCMAWKEIFGYERIEFQHGGVHFLGFNTGPLMRMAYGHVVAQDLAWLKERLESYPRHEPVILVTHYPLMKGDVDNWFEVTDLLRHYNVRLCIGGHYHRTRNLSYDGIPGLLLRSNIREKDTGTGFGLYEVTSDSISLTVMNSTSSPARFASYSMHGDIRDVNGNVLEPDAGAWEYPDTTDNVTYSQVNRVWLYQSGTSIYSSPAVEGKRVFVGDDAGCVTAYRLKDGKSLWTFSTEARIIGTPAVWNGILVVPSADGCVYGLKADNGRMLWKFRTEAPVLGAVAIREGIAYVGGSDHHMRALDVRTGEILWEYSGVEGYVETKPLVTDRHVVFGAWDMYLYCLDVQDGSLLWKWRGVAKDDMHYSPAAVWPVETNGRIFIADPERALTCIDAQTGETIWRTYQSMVRETVGLSADEERIYSKTMRDSMVCYSTQGDTPRQLYATNVGFGYEIAPNMPQELDGVVYCSTKEGMIFATEAHTGRLLWRHYVGSSLVNTVVPLPGRKVLFTTSGGHVGLLLWKGGIKH